MSDLSITSNLSGQSGEEASKNSAKNFEDSNEEQKPKTKRKRKPVKSEYHVIGNDDKDYVYVSAIIFMNNVNRRSLSVHHLQRRLTELGYGEADAGIDGYYDELTRTAFENFQKDEGEEPNGIATLDNLNVLFDGDTNVIVAP